MKITITEALAEIKTIGKRLEKKRESVFQYIGRQEGIKDPLEKSGGSEKFIKQETQAIGDLESRIIALRSGIQRTNDVTTVTIGTISRTISEWLIWKRDVLPKSKEFLGKFRQVIQGIKDNAKRQGNMVVAKGETPQAPTDVIINMDEAKLASQIENLEEVIGSLDGQLSLKNATTFVEIED